MRKDMFNNCTEKQFRVCYLSNVLSLGAFLKVSKTNIFIDISIKFADIKDYNTNKNTSKFSINFKFHIHN